MSSWKTYGGINSFEKAGQINADSITVNTLTIKQVYKGNFDICGELNVFGNTNVSDSFNVNKDSILYGNVTIGHTNTLFDVNSDTTFNGRVFLNSDFIVSGNIIGNSNIVANDNIFIGKVLDFSGGSFLYSYGNALGLNTMTPIAALDISTSLVNAINIHSYNLNNENILTQNVNGQGIVLGVNDNSSYIHFFNYHPISSGLVDSNISLSNDGCLNIDVSHNVNISSPITIGDNNVHPYNDLLAVYDVSTGLYFGNIYQNNSAYSGASASFISHTSDSSTFLYIGTIEKNGGAIGGGTYPADNKRSFATIGLTDIYGNYTPAQNIVSGIKTPYHTTTGINTFKPRTDKYVLDVNGPIHIDNGDITSIITDPPFELYSISAIPGLVTALGSSIDVIKDVSGNYPKERIISSKDNGYNWNYIDVSNSAGIYSGNSVLNGNVFTSLSMYDNNNWFVTGSSMLLNTPDGGNSWQNISTLIEGYTFNNIFINKTGNTISGNVLGYFSLDLSSSMVIFEWPKNTIIQKNPTLKIISTPVKPISSISANSNTIYVAGNSIVKYNASNSIVNQTPTVVWNHSYGTYAYNEIKAFDNSFAIAVGGNIISTTPDGGSTWYDISFNSVYNGSGVNFKSVYISDISNAIAVGSKGNIWITNNKGLLWSPIPQNLINSSGKANWLIDTNNNFRNVVMTDINTIMITSTITAYNYYGNIYGNSQLFNIFAPNFVNRASNSVLDISGTVRISGDLQVNDNGSIISNNSTFNILNNGVQNINFGGHAKSIIIGNVVGNTYIRTITNITNTTNSTNVNSGALIVAGGVGISGNLSIGGSINVMYDSSLNGNVNIGKTTILSNISSSNTNTGALIVHGGVGIGGNINVGGFSHFRFDSSFDGNVLMASKTYSINKNTGALIVDGGVGIGGNLNVGGFSHFTLDSSFNGNVLITSTTPSTNINSGTLIVNGGVGIGGALNVNSSSIFNNSLTAENVYSNNDLLLKGSLYYNATGGTSIYIGPSNIAAGNVTLTLGRPSDTVVIAGAFRTDIKTQTTSTSPTILVNSVLGNATSIGAGIDIFDNNGLIDFPGHTSYLGGNIWGYMHVGQDLQSFIFKTPSFGTERGPNHPNDPLVQLSLENRVRLSVNELNLRDISNNVKRGLLMLQPDVDFQTYQTSKGHFYNGSGIYNDADYAINICPDFDISNILLKDFDTISGTQTIGSNLNIGNLISYPVFSVYGTTNLYGNANLYASYLLGNTTLSGNLNFSGNTLIGNTIYRNINGNIGIGTINPLVLLDVSGSSRFMGPLVSTNYDTIRFNTNFGSNWSQSNIVSGGSSYFQDITMSYDSKYRYVLIYDKFGFGSVNKSSDYGSSWTVTNLPKSYAGNVIYQAVPFMNSNIATFTFQDLAANIDLQNAIPLNIQVGKYTASASSNSIGQPYLVFGNTNTVWSSLNNYNSDGVYIGTINTIDSNAIQNISGEYIQIQLPYSFILKSYQHYPLSFTSNYTKTIYVFGSNNLSSWYNLNINGNTISFGGNTFVSFPNNTSYSNYRFVIGNTYIGVNTPVITRIDLSGIFQNYTGSFASSIAASGTGRYVTVANQGYYSGTGNLYISSDYGNTFNDYGQKADAMWQSVAISKTGTIQAAVGINPSASGNIFISNNAGLSWTPVLSKLNGWQSISISSTGQYITAVQAGNLSSGLKGNVWTSSDYGSTWNSTFRIFNNVQSVNGFLNLSASDFNKTVCVSSSGQYQTVLGLADSSNTIGGNANIWISNNYGVNWIDSGYTMPVLNGTSILSSISMTGAGQNQIATFIGGNTGLDVPTNNVYGGVLTSNDYGVTWIDTLSNVPPKSVGGNTYYGYFQKAISSFNGQFNFAMPKYQDLSGNTYNNTNSTAVNIDNLYSNSVNIYSNMFNTQYLGSSNTGNVFQTHGLQLSVPTVNNASLMMGYEIDLNSSYINSADQNSATPLLLNTNGGFVGIGMTVPTYPLDVNGGSIRISNGVGNNTGNILFGSTGVGGSQSAYISSSSTDMTIRNQQSGNLFIGTNNLTRMTLDINGNVGIGTIVPAYKLDVIGGSIRISNSVGSNTGNILFGSTGVGGSQSAFISSSSTDMTIRNQQTGSLFIGTNNATRMTLDINGNVGIGTIVPAYKLDVIGGDFRISNGVGGGYTGNIRFGSVGVGLTQAAYISSSLTDMTILNQQIGSLFIGTNNATRMTLDINGNVGIGTTNPAYPLDVNGGSLRISNGVGSNTGNILFGSTGVGGSQSAYISSSSTDMTIRNQQNGNLFLGTNNATRMTVATSGNVGIGTTNPAYPLDVDGGSIRISNGVGNNTGNILFGSTGVGGSQSAFISSSSTNMTIRNQQNGSLFLGTNNLTRMTIISSGNLGIGTTSPSFNLDVTGTIRATGQITGLSFNASSDYRLKSNVKPISRTIDYLKPIEYDLSGGSHDMGFIAHEVQEFFPFLVTGEKDGKYMQGINYNGFIALLVKEVQDLKRENISLKQRLDRIESLLS